MTKALRILAVTVTALVAVPTLATEYVVDQIEPLFQLAIGNQLLQGNLLVDLEMQPIDGNTDLRYSGTFAPIDGFLHHVLRLDPPSWDSWVASMGALNGRWLDFEVEVLNGELVRSGIFLEDNAAEDYSYHMDSESDENDFVANLDTNREAGRQIIDFESYRDTLGNTRFGGLWVDGTTQPRTHLYFGLSLDELDDLLDPLKGRVVDLERYSDDQARVRYGVILAMSPGGTSYVEHAMDGAGLSDADVGRGDNLIDLDSYEISPGVLIYNGVWGDDWKSLRQVAPYPPANFVPNGQEIDSVQTVFETTAPTTPGLIGLFAMSLRNGEAVGYRTDEPFYLASSSKVAIHARLWQLHEAGDLNLTTDELQYGTSGTPGSVPWYVDERSDPGLSTGPCATPDLDLLIPLEDLDAAMMQSSDNSATSMLVDDPTYGVSSGPWTVELNEWLAGLSGVGRGWGMVTAIQDVERMLLWQGQQLTGAVDEPSYFSAPAAGLETLSRNSYRQCWNQGSGQWTNRCGSCGTTCSGNDVCLVRWDVWGDLTAHLQTLDPGWPNNSYPNCVPGNPPMVSPGCNISWFRYYEMGLNTATPRAFGLLQEQLATGQLLNPGNTTAALDVMTEFNNMMSGVPGHIVTASKAGSKGGFERPCTYTAIFRIGPDDVVVAAFTKDSPNPGDGTNCSAVNTFMSNPLGTGESLGRIALKRLTADLKATDPELVGFGPTTVHQGQDFSVALDVANTGQIDAPAFNVTFYAVTDGVIGDEDDLEIATVAVGGVPAGGVVELRETVSFPSILPAQYQFAYIIDPTDSVNLPVGEVGEFTEGNDNSGLLSDAVLTVLPAGPPCEDLDLDGYHDCHPGCDSNGLTCGDCNDATNLVAPLAVDTCNQLDDDCDGIPDPGAARPASLRVVEDTYPEQSDELGASVARLGDLNGDGVDEYAVGQPDAHSPVASYAGVVRVYSGLDGSLYCEAYDPDGGAFDDFGTSIAGLPDVTGDPVPDFIVGSPGHSGAEYSAGAALVFGGATCLMHRRILPQPAEQGELFGTTVAAVGDVNLDGEEDVAIGSPERGGSTGAIVVYSVNDVLPLHTLTNPAGGRLGTAILGPGDMDGDLVPDILAGIHHRNGGQGAVMVFSGSSGALLNTWTRTILVSGDNFGFSLASLGDVTGDDIPDIVVGTINADTLAGTDVGEAQLLSGADGTPLFSMADLSGEPGDDFGYSVAAAGDVDGDGVPDIAVGQPLHEGSGGIDAGGVMLFSGATGVPLLDLEDPAGRAGDRLGWSLAQLGDLTGDGLPELAAGAAFADAIEAADAGRVLIWSMEADCDADGVTPFDGDCDDQVAVAYPGAVELCDAIDNDCDSAIDEDNDGDSFTVCDPDECNDADAAIHAGAPERCNGLDDDCDTDVDEGADVDLDGYSDVCDCDDGSGAINPGATDDTCDRIDLDCNNVTDDGFASPVGERVMELDPGSAGAQAGTSVAVIGDLNGDGLAELAIGVPVDNTGGLAAGAVAVFDGATGGLHCMMLSSDPGSFDDLGRSIAVLDDATGDGVPDLLAGAPRDDDPESESGTLAVFSGADCSMAYKTFDPGSGFQILLGQAVGAIGDVTGDGLTDYAAAAPTGDDVGIPNAGYVVAFDGETGDVLYRVYNINATAYEQFGSSIAGGRDLDADGVPDFVVGSHTDDTRAGSQAGSVLVVSGATGTPLRKLIDDDGFFGDNLGFSVALIEDLDGDTVADILAGSPNHDAGGTNAGAVLAFSGATGDFIGRAAFNEPSALPVMGRSIAVMPDVDGDGVADIAAGAPEDDEGATDTGSVYLISGADLSLIRRLTRPVGQAGEEIGTSVAVSPDLTGDGMPEIIAGAPLHDGAAGTSSGLAVVFALEADCDGDGVSPFGGDCDDGNGDAYGRPGDVELLVFDDKENASWQPPSDTGGTVAGLAYDMLQSGDAADFSTTATCVESQDTDATAFILDTPGPGTALYYVVRARNACDVGPAGDDSGAIERPARACP